MFALFNLENKFDFKHFKITLPIIADSKLREVELAMWKRRATYDPMKAAAEGRKKLEEAKKAAQLNDRYAFILV